MFSSWDTASRSEKTLARERAHSLTEARLSQKALISSLFLRDSVTQWNYVLRSLSLEDLDQFVEVDRHKISQTMATSTTMTRKPDESRTLRNRTHTRTMDQGDSRHSSSSLRSSMVAKRAPRCFLVRIVHHTGEMLPDRTKIKLEQRLGRLAKPRCCCSLREVIGLALAPFNSWVVAVTTQLSVLASGAPDSFLYLFSAAGSNRRLSRESPSACWFRQRAAVL